MTTDGTSPLAAPDDGPDSHARHLADLIQIHLHVKLGAATVATIRTHLWRVGSENQADLVSSIFLECFEIYKSGAALTEGVVRLAADRVRQRLIREAKRVGSAVDTRQTSAVEMPPDDEAEFVIRQFREFLRQKSVQDVLLFEWYYLENFRDVSVIASKLNISAATVYRKLAAIRSDYLALRDIRQPPHEAD